MVKVALGGAIKQTAVVVETCTDDTHCNRFGSIECQTWTDVAWHMDIEVAGTDDAGYMLINGKCLVELNAKKLDCV